MSVPPSRRRAALAVGGLGLLALALRLAGLRHGLPFVLQTDTFQIDQAVSLLRQGWFVDAFDYPHALVYVYAAAGALAFVAQSLGAALGLAGDPGSWTEWTARFADPALHHSVGRAVSAVAGALLVPATYRIARVGFTRPVALLAAAAVALDPAQIAGSRLVRPHVPVMLVIALVAPTLLHLARRGGTAAAEASSRDATGPRRGGTSRGARHDVRRAARAGAGLGAAAVVFPLGPVAGLWATLLLAWRLRPAWRAAACCASLLAGFLLAWAALGWLAGLDEIARPLPGGHAFGKTSTLSLPVRMLDWLDPSRLPAAALNWLASSPVLFAFAALFLVAGVQAGRRAGARVGAQADMQADARVPAQTGARAAAPRVESWRRALDAASFPLLVFLVMSLLVGAHGRYALSATPFLAGPAAAACLTLGPRAWRLAAPALLLLPALAGTLALSAILARNDTRLACAALLPELAERGARVALQDRLVLDRSLLPPGVMEFPPYGEAWAWWQRDFAPRRELTARDATVYLRATGSAWSDGPLSGGDLRALGFEHHGTIGAAPPSSVHLPDLPDRLWVQLVRARRPGPPIEIWARGEGLAAVRATLDAAAATDSGAHAPHAELVARVREGAAEAGGAAGGALGSSLQLVSADVDGDGRLELVSSNVDAATLAELLALPPHAEPAAPPAASSGSEAVATSATDSATDSATAAATAAPRLTARGALENSRPFLLLLTGAPPGRLVEIVMRVSYAPPQGAAGGGAARRGAPSDPGEGATRLLAEIPGGSAGCLALAAPWPRAAPAGTTLTIEARVRDPDAPQGFVASNTLVLVSPR